MPRSARLLLAGGAAMAIGAFAPWVSVIVIDVSGLDLRWGILTLLAGLVCTLAGYQVWKGGVFSAAAEKSLLKVALCAAIAGTVAPIYVAADPMGVLVAAKVPGGTFDAPRTTVPKITQVPPSSSFNNGLQQFSNALADMFGPKAAFGVWLSMFGGLVALAGSYDHLAKQRKPAEPPD